MARIWWEANVNEDSHITGEGRWVTPRLVDLATAGNDAAGGEISTWTENQFTGGGYVNGFQPS